MTIKEESRNDVVVLALSGTLMSGPEVTPLHDRIKQLVEGGITKVVIDFSEVQWFGSATLGVLTASLVTLQNAKGGLRLTGVTKTLESILKVTRLGNVFQKIDTVDQAIASFKTQSP